MLLKVSSWGEPTKLMYDHLAQRSLIEARDFLNKGSIANAEKYIKKHLRYAKLRDDMFAGAADLLGKNLEVVQSLLIAEVSMRLAELVLLVSYPKRHRQ